MVAVTLPLIDAAFYREEEYADYTPMSELEMRAIGAKSKLTLTLKLEVPAHEAAQLYEILKDARGRDEGSLKLGLPHLAPLPVEVIETKESRTEVAISDVYQDKW